jgi:hypothetical protein
MNVWEWFPRKATERHWILLATHVVGTMGKMGSRSLLSPSVVEAVRSFGLSGCRSGMSCPTPIATTQP